MIEEGGIKLCLKNIEITKKAETFYNPEKKIDRDISIELLRELGMVRFKMLDLLAGSGIYSLRIAKELSPSLIIMNDLNPKAVETIKRNIEINKDKIRPSTEIEVTCQDARTFSYPEKFDYIDIDPFGSPVPYLPAAFVNLKRHGVISITSTDIGCLIGKYPLACRRRYGASVLRCFEEKELGIRVLIKRFAEIASMYDYGIKKVILSYWYKHIFRIFFEVKKSRTLASSNYEKILFCKYSEKEGWIFLEKNLNMCSGPLWTGEIWDKNFFLKIGGLFKKLSIKGILGRIREEVKINTDMNIFYDIRRFVPKGKPLPKLREIIEKTKKPVAPSIFSATGIRAEADFWEIKSLMM